MERTTPEDMSEYNLRGILGVALVLGIGPSEQTFRRLVLDAGLVDAVDADSNERLCAYFFLDERDPRIRVLLSMYNSYTW